MFVCRSGAKGVLVHDADFHIQYFESNLQCLLDLWSMEAQNFLHIFMVDDGFSVFSFEERQFSFYDLLAGGFVLAVDVNGVFLF